MKQYETVIGLEVHVELSKQKSKFSADAPLNSEEHQYTYMPGLHR